MKRKSMIAKGAALVGCLGFFLVAQVQAQGVSARDAAVGIAQSYGANASQWIAEVRAVGGVPQPRQWDFLSFDGQSSHLLRRFLVSDGRATDVGPDRQRYPVDVPVGYFSMNQVSVDSVAAFTIAEGEARRAKMGFDSCNYLLRVREYSSEPIWRLEMLDASRRLVGKIYLSAQNGEVLRTVWVYYNQGGRIIDSAAPGAIPPGGLSSTTAPPMQSGIVTGDYSGRPPVPGQTGITGVAPKPYTPVSPGGVPSEQPAMTRPAAPAALPVVSTPPVVTAPVSPPVASAPTSPASPETSAPSSGSSPMNDIRNIQKPKPDPTQPPVPTTGSGSSGRIPPPPIPQ